MRSSYKILYQGGTGEVTEKKSRFIACTRPVKTEEEALAFIEEMRKTYWDARHHCYAWVIGKKGEHKRCSDDGEPAQTAGRPILDVLEGEGVVGACVVVTRYFGGTLLGTGGLVRAYSGAAQEGLKSSVVLTVEPGETFSLTADYNGIGKIQYMLAQEGITVLGSGYTDKVELTILVPQEKAGKIQTEIADITGGQAEVVKLEDVYYGVVEKEVLLFPEE
ncbi:MAG: YigZ family protein [Lacrimispora sp.]|uniref:YigZ family protein n=1 Tax=Lacrimispora sp. TaxID=2719234 RepID=UPI0039E37588